MRTQKDYPDVFLSYSLIDKPAADVVRDSLENAGFDVFDPQKIDKAESISEAIWRALATSEALVLVVPANGEPTPNAATELGAAMAWRKPIFVVRQRNGHAKTARFLSGFKTYPLSRIDDLANAIRRGRKSLSGEDLELLKKTYLEMGVPTDRYMLDPALLDELARRFCDRTDAHIAGEHLLQEMIRHRKQGHWPRLKRHPRSARSAS